jgi:hypothetical protein
MIERKENMENERVRYFCISVARQTLPVFIPAGA